MLAGVVVVEALQMRMMIFYADFFSVILEGVGATPFLVSTIFWLYEMKTYHSVEVVVTFVHLRQMQRQHIAQEVEEVVLVTYHAALLFH